MTVPLEVVPVEIKNWSDQSAKPRYVKRTTVKTWALDPASPVGEGSARSVQICDYEPDRVRTIIQVIDTAVTLTTEAPVARPDVSSATVAPQGRHLAPSTQEYVLFGPDAFWINTLVGATRVTVTKEYC